MQQRGRLGSPLLHLPLASANFGKASARPNRGKGIGADLNAMPQTTPTPKPRSVAIAIQFIWVTLAVNALMLAIGYDDAGSDALAINSTLLVFTGYVAIQIAGCRNWARVAYASLVALDVALILALGLDAATDLEVVLTYLLLALEILALLKLFGSDADQWFNPARNCRDPDGPTGGN